MENRRRYHELDYLRGLMALAVLVFHYDKWLTGAWDAATLQGKLGVYAVSIFFVLSGLALTLVYKGRITSSPQSWRYFYKKRFLRIFPLLWLATTVTLLLDEVARPTSVILLNFSGLFGFVNPAGDIATGAWSIGCELVFYTFFPFFLLLSKRSAPGFLVLLAITLLAAGCWAFGIIPSASTQEIWWKPYTMVANHAFFFTGGMALGLYRSYLEKMPLNGWRLILIISILAFIFLPVGSDPVVLVQGEARIWLSLCSLLICAAVFQIRLGGQGIIHQFMIWLGAISYSLYLLHPIVFRAIRAAFKHLDVPESYWGMLVCSSLASLIAGHVSYHYFEKRFITPPVSPPARYN
jgi:peptidoglycan/LPS O-acetylase OafA/YrhL